MPLDKDIAAEAAAQYAREYDRYRKLAELVHGVCTELIDSAGIRATTQWRAKQPRSFHHKLLRYLIEDNKAKVDAVTTPTDAVELLGDLAGVRIATYVEGDTGRIVKLIVQTFRPPAGMEAVEVERKTKETGYRGTHCQVRLPDTLAKSPTAFNIVHTSAEIQVCSMLAHVWNEIEHDLRYKESLDWGSDLAFRDETFDAFLRETLDADKAVESLLGLHSEKIATALSEPIGALLVALPAFEENAVAVLREFVRLGYAEVGSIVDNFLTDTDVAVSNGYELIGAINGRFDVEEQPGELRLDMKNADVLLALLLEKHAADIAALYEQQLETGEALRIPRIAAAVRESGPFT